jgi:hypothetical protein
MASVKMKSKVDEGVWEDVRKHASESVRSLSDILTEALRSISCGGA